MPRSRSWQRPFKSFDKFAEGDADYLANLAKFQQVESPLSRFIPTDERLRFAQSFRQLALLQPGTEAKLTKKGAKRIVFTAVDVLAHTSHSRKDDNRCKNCILTRHVQADMLIEE